mmetsp:Transcript_139598/g.434231  ORF Transcript_139598/g.434231 Transcript_139598/m.434231 type:complete len:361 (+) Transcript_139598:81-1163(+)
MATSVAAESTALGSSAPAPQRGVGGLKWSEVRERVQQPDGSVRTSPPFKSGGAGSAFSPPRPRPQGLSRFEAVSCGKATTAPASSSREGTSRGGSSGKSSRSSSRDALARDGDISSRCSSGGWDTSTNSSELSRPRTPPDVAPSPSGTKDLLMPDPIRTIPMLPPSLFDVDQEKAREDKAAREEAALAAAGRPREEQGHTVEDAHLAAIMESKPGKKDPFGRDNPERVQVRSEWSAEPLAKFLQGIVSQIDTNLQNHCVPTSEKLDTFVSRLVANMHRQVKHAPKRIRKLLQDMFAKRFQKIWNVVRNEKVTRSISPEELKVALIGLIESLTSEFGVNPEVVRAVNQSRPRRASGGMKLR